MRRPLWILFCIVVCMQFSLRYITSGLHLWINLKAYSLGLERLPYQNRILMDWVLRWTAGSQHLGPILTRISAHMPGETATPYVLVELIVSFVCALAITYATGKSLIALGTGPGFAWKASLGTIALFSILNFLVAYSYAILPYDLPSMAFFAVGIWLVLTSRPALFTALFCVATLNRETTIFLTLFFVLYEYFRVQQQGRKLPSIAVLLYAALQVVFWVAVRIWLHRLFASNPTDEAPNHVFSVHLLPNLHSTLNPLQWPMFFCAGLVIFGPIWLAKQQRVDPPFVTATVCMVALWIAAMYIVGVIVELRIFSELMCPIAICLGAALWNRSKQRSATGHRTMEAQSYTGV